MKRRKKTVVKRKVGKKKAVRKKTAKKKSSRGLTALIDLAASKPIRQRCWAETSPAGAKDFIAACLVKVNAGEYINYSEVTRILSEHFDVIIGNSRVRNHLQNACVCAARRRR